jgi:lambda repressor-like predicted transcriptional regulator
MIVMEAGLVAMTTSNGEKPMISDVLKAELKKHGFTLARAAKTLRISPDSLRGWISRNRFPQEELLKLAKLGAMPTDLGTLQELYQYGVHTQPELTSSDPALQSVRDVLGFMDQRVDDLRRFYRDFGHDVQLLFGALGQGDLFVYCALDKLPYEVDSVGWTVTGTRITEAVRRGAFLIYFYPSKEVVNVMKELQIRNVPDPREFKGALEAFKARIQKATNGPSQDHINNHVFAIECQTYQFMVPGHKYVLFQPKPPAAARALARFPIGSDEKEMFLHLPLAEGITSQFLNFIIETLHRAKRDDLVSLFSL